jgi:hypothetical protein
MSAWIVWPGHVSYLVAGALVLAPDGFITFGREKLLTPHTKDAVGQLLMDENVRSVQHRYNRDTFEELPGPVDKTGIFDYRHIESSVAFDPIVLLKQIACYEYQSCERPDWPQTDAYAFCQVVRSLAEAALPDDLRRLERNRWASGLHLIPAYRNSDAYEDASWGIDPNFSNDSQVAEDANIGDDASSYWTSEVSKS